MIAFMQRLPSTPTNDFDIVVMNTDGSNEVNLTRGTRGARYEDPDRRPGGSTSGPRPPRPSRASPGLVPRSRRPRRLGCRGARPTAAWSWAAPAGGRDNVRCRSATSTNAVFAPYAWWLKATTARSATFVGVKGVTYCFSAMAEGQIGERVRVERRALHRGSARRTAPMVASTGWSRIASGATGYYQNSYSASSTAGSTLTSSNLRGRRLGLLVTKSPTAGTIQILWNGTVLGRVSLTTSTTIKKSLVRVAPFTSVQTGTLQVKVVSSGKRVEIDGVGVSRSEKLRGPRISHIGCPGAASQGATEAGPSASLCPTWVRCPPVSLHTRGNRSTSLPHSRLGPLAERPHPYRTASRNDI